MSRWFSVELRAEPDSPNEERRANGKLMGPQTVLYPAVFAVSPDEAAEIAVRTERRFAYRERVWAFAVVEIGDHDVRA